MIGLYKYIESPFGEKTYFAGANSGVGFVNLFGDFYEESSLDRLYIIKGGPGTGKSTFMRILAGRAADAGAGAEYFLCGSDPSSLDAVVLSGGGKRIAVIDGTSPHAYDAKYPGAVSAVLDFGSFWDKGILESERGRIISLAKKKSGCFERSYRFLAALSVMRVIFARSPQERSTEKSLPHSCEGASPLFRKVRITAEDSEHARLSQ